MRIAQTRPLFAWDALEDSPNLRTLKRLLESLPDAALLDGLRQMRGRGRDDYPVRVLWGVMVLSIALRHVTIEACLDELRRNADLRRLIGIDRERQVPKKWNMSRFLDVLGQEPHRTRLHAVFNVMAQRLGQAVPDLGRDTAGDATSLNARRKRHDKAAKAEVAEGLPQPSGGRKEYTDDQGAVTKVVTWFGYKLHLIVDVKHEVSLAYHITDTKVGDGETLPTILQEAQANLPAGRMRSLAYDKAADGNDVHALLDEADIKPLIRNRKLWKEESEKMLPGHDGNSNVVYDESGTLHCYDKVNLPIVRHKMAYTGYEHERGTLKYRCPAVHEGWSCPSQDVCNAGREFGMTVRVKRDIDLRRFPPIPRATKQFERLYKGRTAVERVNGRLKILWGADDGNIRGARRFHAFVGCVTVVHLAFATVLASTPRRDGTLGKMRISPIARVLQATASG
jgi:Transposase DDE domain/Transposase domain (DUF772)